MGDVGPLAPSNLLYPPCPEPADPIIAIPVPVGWIVPVNLSVTVDSHK